MKLEKVKPAISGRDENEKLIFLLQPPQAWPKSVIVPNMPERKKEKVP